MFSAWFIPLAFGREFRQHDMNKRPVIVGVGEILWDMLPDGPRFGGAPANFACSAAELSQQRADVFVVSAVGKDELGAQAIAALQAHRVHTSGVTSLDQPTGRVRVRLDERGCATYEFDVQSAWDYLPWSATLEHLANQADAVCFGSLGQRSPLSRQTILRFVGMTSQRAVRVFDVNVRRPFVCADVVLTSLQLANVLKLNSDELPYLAELCEMPGSEVEVLRQLQHRFELQAVALTRGAKGSLLMRGDEISDVASGDVHVTDTIGAGDAFSATMTLGLLEDADLNMINRNASAVAAYVCTQPGATPKIPATLLSHSLRL